MNQATETGNYNSWQGEKSNKIDSKMAQVIELLDNDFKNWIGSISNKVDFRRNNDNTYKGDNENVVNSSGECNSPNRLCTK